jgi:hypothetical protein
MVVINKWSHLRSRRLPIIMRPKLQKQRACPEGHLRLKLAGRITPQLALGFIPHFLYGNYLPYFSRKHNKLFSRNIFTGDTQR